MRRCAKQLQVFSILQNKVNFFRVEHSSTLFDIHKFLVVATVLFCSACFNVCHFATSFACPVVGIYPPAFACNCNVLCLFVTVSFCSVVMQLCSTWLNICKHSLFAAFFVCSALFSTCEYFLFCYILCLHRRGGYYPPARFNTYKFFIYLR